MRLFFHTAVLASVMVALSSAQTIFSDAVPTDYYSRKDLSDCSARFHKRTIFQKTCFVFGGEPVNVTEFPHMAVLGWLPEGNDTDIRWMCGGSLITEQFVLTAAHCTADADNVEPRLVRLGDVNLASDADDEYAQQYEIRRIIRHPSHRFSRKYFDLALIELNGTVRVTEGVCPGCLWTKKIQPQHYYETAGFGETSFGSGSVPNLFKTFLLPKDHASCTAAFRNTRGLAQGIAADQLCASNFKSDTCQGDSGGPLQVTLGSFFRLHPYVVGVTSFGRGCGTGSYGVYQLLADHIPWIESVVNETMDSVRCIERYSAHRPWKFFIPECAIRDGYVSRVRLVWPKGSPGSLINCTGTLIDYNTVITSARCARAGGDIPPAEVVIRTSESMERVKIIEIQIHPDFREPSYVNDLALLRLEKYLQPNSYNAPSCIPLPSNGDICSDQQTHDPVACWNQFAKETKAKLLTPACSREEAYEQSTVKLLWSETSDDSPCVGMLIKTDTVITSIRCMNDRGEDPPTQIELVSGERIKVSKILKHAGFDRKTPGQHDTALLLLGQDLTDRLDLIPGCLRHIGSNSSITYVSVHGPDNWVQAGDSMYYPIAKHCNDSMAQRYANLFDPTLVNSTRFTCWNVNRHVAPGVVIPERGSGLLDDTHKFIRGVNTYSLDYGSVEPVISTNLTAYIDWITRFVLYRPPLESLVFRSGDDEFDHGSPCTTPSGTEGNCLPDYVCRRETERYKANRTSVKFCGFEDTIGYVCCPPEHQDIPVVQERPQEIDLLPRLPYEN